MKHLLFATIATIKLSLLHSTETAQIQQVNFFRANPNQMSNLYLFAQNQVRDKFPAIFITDECEAIEPQMSINGNFIPRSS